MESPAYHAAPMPAPPPAVAPPDPAPVVPPAAAPADRAPPPARPRTLLRTAAGFYGIVIVFAAGYALFSGGIRTLFGETGPSLGHVLAAVALAGLVVGATHLAGRSVPVVDRAWKALAELLGPVDTRTAILLALFSGVGEELLFRGALWPLGLVGTSLLFGLVHVVPKRALLVYPVFATLVGLLFGLLRQGSGSVLPPMLAHGLVNGVNLLLLTRRRPAAPAAP